MPRTCGKLLRVDWMRRLCNKPGLWILCEQLHVLSRKLLWSCSWVGSSTDVHVSEHVSASIQLGVCISSMWLRSAAATADEYDSDSGNDIDHKNNYCITDNLDNINFDNNSPIDIHNLASQLRCIHKLLELPIYHSVRMVCRQLRVLQWDVSRNQCAKRTKLVRKQHFWLQRSDCLGVEQPANLPSATNQLLCIHELHSMCCKPSMRLVCSHVIVLSWCSEWRYSGGCARHVPIWKQHDLVLEPIPMSYCAGRLQLIFQL